jgi:hypothetical protein
MKTLHHFVRIFSCESLECTSIQPMPIPDVNILNIHNVLVLHMHHNVSLQIIFSVHTLAPFFTVSF